MLPIGPFERHDAAPGASHVHPFQSSHDGSRSPRSRSSSPRSRRRTHAGQDDESAAAKRVYDQIKRFALTGGSAEVTNLTLKRDRVELTFTGTFYFAGPVEQRITGAVFVGQGTMRATVPASDFERDNVKRLLGAETVESDFRTAVLRFTDDTLARLDVKPRAGGDVADAGRAPRRGVRTAIPHRDGRQPLGRIAASLLNAETPGVFFAQFDGGRRNRFSLLLDPQTRIPVANFGINGGEKGSSLPGNRRSLGTTSGWRSTPSRTTSAASSPTPTRMTSSTSRTIRWISTCGNSTAGWVSSPASTCWRAPTTSERFRSRSVKASRACRAEAREAAPRQRRAAGRPVAGLDPGRLGGWLHGVSAEAGRGEAGADARDRIRRGLHPRRRRPRMFLSAVQHRVVSEARLPRSRHLRRHLSPSQARKGRVRRCAAQRGSPTRRIRMPSSRNTG